MAEPLDGIIVVEMTIAVQGPAAALYLRDMGADVIKVEPPLGEASRHGRARYNETPEGTIGPQFVSGNRGKRSVCVDLSTDLGLSAVHALLKDADVFLTNYREPALVKMGLGYDDLHSKYPKLIYASVNGFGPKGPDADKAMLDGAAVARGGLVNMTGAPDQPPFVPGAIVGDTSGAMQLALGVMTALFARERQGIAQRVQTSALGTQLWLQQWELTHFSVTGAPLKRDGNHHPAIRGPYGVYETSDGGAILLATTMEQENWDAFCIFADVPELALDPRLQLPGQRLGEGMTDDDSDEIRAKIRHAFKQKAAMEWDAFLRTQPEIIWERVRNYDQVFEDEQSIINNYFTTVNIPGVGEKKTVGNLITLSETPGSPKGDHPELGEANQELLSAAGMSSEEISEIEERATAEREAAIAELLAAAGGAD